MPNVTAASVLAEAQSVYLNDASALLFTDTILTPFLKTAYEHFRNECALNGLNIEYRTATKTIAANAVTYGTLPTDFLLPIKIEERTTGSTDPYIPMTEVRFLPQIVKSTSLIYWTWFDSDIKFVGSTQSNDILLTYYWDFAPTAVTNATTDLRGNGRSYLAAKTAALASMFVNQNETLAGKCDLVAESQLIKIIGIMIRNTQGTPTRQAPFGRRRSFSY